MANKKSKAIELLAPARNLECGMAAVDHGADAVYIGAPRFGARAAATNSVDEIGQLVTYAHRFGVKVYVTLNTILRDDELADATQLVWQLYRLGVDALIVQDMALTRLALPPIPLHASTQMDNRTVDKARFLAQAGFRQVVLARELSLDEIRAIHEAVPQVALEVFVHGALCVSYSGQCYASQACFGRSANRGECAQFCRLPFTLVDADNRVITQEKHLLSLRDMNRLNRLEELLDAGVTSLKIEGRLKEASYVKNVTAAYRQALDELFKRRPEYVAASAGRVTTTFTPQVDKSFSRGFTSYFLDGRGEEVASMETPKSMGEWMGTLKEQRPAFITVAGVKPFHNGDGACYLDEKGQLQGFRVNRVESGKLFPSAPLPRIKPRTPIYRNYDQEFEKLLARRSAERKIGLSWQLWDVADGFVLQATDEQGYRAARRFPAEKQLAQRPQEETISKQLQRLGDTPFEVRTVTPSSNLRSEANTRTESNTRTEANTRSAANVCSKAISRNRANPHFESNPRLEAKSHSETHPCSEASIEIRFSQPWFIPSSLLADWRRQLIEALERVRRIRYPQEVYRLPVTTHPWGASSLTYLGNVSNREARTFYQMHGVSQIAPAFEQQPVPDAVVMFCKHCLRYSMGWCPTRQKGRSPFREPYTLVSGDGRRFRLEFDCKLCQMRVVMSR